MSTFVERVTGLLLREPLWLLLALLVPLVLLLCARAPRPWAVFAPAGLLPRLRSVRLGLRALPRVLQVAGLLLLIFALARPAVRVRVPDAVEGIDILLCLDVSSSMQARDMDRERSRLEVARAAGADFVRGRPQDRIGLLTFARYADLVCPPTLDHDALVQMLAAVQTVEGEGPEDATGIGAAVARCAQVLRSGGGRGRVVILLTDGEENVAVTDAEGEIPPAHAAQLCERLGVKVQAVVAGRARRAADGTLVPIDTRPVERLAERTGGVFQRARDAAAVAAVYARIDRLERAPVEEARFVLQDRYLGFLLWGLTLLAAARLLAVTWLEVRP